MPHQNRIHLFGASASGTTTLGRALAQRLGVLHLDTDDFYWQPSDPPFVNKHTVEQRLSMIRARIKDTPSWILSGSLCSWGDSLLEDFTLAIFVRLDHATRMQRLHTREHQRYGPRIKKGGDMYELNRAFIEWAASYDTGQAPERSYDLHTKWIRSLPCPVFEIDAIEPLNVSVDKILDHLKQHA